MARMSDTTRRALSGGLSAGWSAAPLAASKVCSGSDLATAIGKGNQPIDAAIRRDIPIATCIVTIPDERIPLTPARPACRGRAGLWRSGHLPRSIGALLVARFSTFDHVIRGALIARGGCSVAPSASTAALAPQRKESIYQWPALPLTAIFWE